MRTYTVTLDAPPTGATYESLSVAIVGTSAQRRFRQDSGPTNTYDTTVATPPTADATFSQATNLDGSVTVTVMLAVDFSVMVTQLSHNENRMGWWLFVSQSIPTNRLWLSRVDIDVRLSYTLRRAALVQDLTVVASDQGTWGERDLMFPPWFLASAEATVQARIDVYAKPRDVHVVEFAMQQADAAMSDEIAAIQAGDFIGLLIKDPRTRTEINGFVFVMNVGYNLHRNRPPVKRFTCLQTGIAVVRNPVIFAVNNIPLAVNDVVLGVNG